MQHLSWIVPIAFLVIILSLEFAALCFSARTLKVYICLSVILTALVVLASRVWLAAGYQSQCTENTTSDTIIRCKTASVIQSVVRTLFGRNNVTIGTVSWIVIAFVLVLFYRQLRILNNRNDVPQIEIGDFPDVTPDYAHVPNNVRDGYVEAQLRSILSRSLLALGQVPGPRVPLTTSALLQGVSTLDTGAFGKLIAFALNWINPRRRWRLEGATFGDGSSHPCGLYLNLLDLRTERPIITETFWANDWETAIEKAGYYVIAAALQQVRTDPPTCDGVIPMGMG
jgi:hypothetical protein